MSVDFATITPSIMLSDEEELAWGGWADEAHSMLRSVGAVLLRGPISRQDGAELAISKIDDELLEDAFWSTPRTRVGGKTLTATEYPSARTIALHSEMAYMKTWPRFVAFHSIEVASEGGGETTICNIDQVSSRLGELLRRFEEKGVTYRRAFRKGVDITWQNAFQTNERDHVEDIARLIGMKLEWRQNDTLITSHTAQGTIESEDGKPIYFNQAHLFHPSALDAQVRTALTKMFGADALPRSASYGDGEPIADEDLIAVRAAFDAYQTKMCWRPGDVLILDNMRFAHGRLPFKGARRLNVALARKVDHPVRSRL